MAVRWFLVAGASLGVGVGRDRLVVEQAEGEAVAAFQVGVGAQLAQDVEADGGVLVCLSSSWSCLTRSVSRRAGLPSAGAAASVA
jgi:hypothetical protein